MRPVVPIHSLEGARALVRWTLRHGRVLWLCALALAIPAGWRTASLYVHLHSELEQLLPAASASVVANEELRSRMPGLQLLGVIVDSGDAARLPAAERFLDDLARRIQAYPRSLARGAFTTDEPERRFLRDHMAIYARIEDLKAIRARIEARRDYDVEKATDALLDADSSPPALDFGDIEERYRGASRFDDERFSSRAQHLTLLLVEPGDSDTDRSHGAELLAQVRRDIADLGGTERYAPGMSVGFTGDVAIHVEETDALLADLSVSSIVVAALVAGVILFYYRWWPSIVALLPPLVLATVYAFALATLPPLSVTALNSNTAFLGSIVVGNGVNFGIVLLARHLEARRAGADLEQSLVVAVAGALRGTLTAAIAASVSYASLALTQFRGFRQFGFVGALGMLLSWAMAFLLMPPLLKWLERGGRWAPRRRPARAAPLAWAARGIALAPRAVVAASLALTVFAACKVRGLDAGWIESDFSRLRRADTWEHGEGYWGRRMEALLGAYLTPVVIVTDDVTQARAVAAMIDRMREHGPLAGRIASVRTVDDVVPPDQEAKSLEVRAIREDLTPRLRAAVPTEQLELIARLLAPSAAIPVTAADLPARLVTGLRERDGTFGREVLVFPRPSKALWAAAPLRELVDALRDGARAASATGGRPGRVAGSLPLSADIVSAVRRDGPRATLVALLGVATAVLVVLGLSRPGAVVITSLLVAVTWLVAATVVLGVRLNFANFIAYPITFGIGVDYVVNVVSRYLQDPRRDMGAVLRSTGGAVALCSLTTIIGYSSLLMAKNRGLVLFGLVAVLGEICCLLTAVVAVPALLEWDALRAADARERSREPRFYQPGESRHE